MATGTWTPYASVKPFLKDLPTWYPEEEQERIGAYRKYDEMYWNEETQFQLRILEGEEKLYVPNPRTIVDTTSHYLLKGLQITTEDDTGQSETSRWLSDFLDREKFLSKFHVAKHSGVARGDFVLHIYANPNKLAGTRVSCESIDPEMVVPIWAEDDPDSFVGCHLVDQYVLPDDPTRVRIKKLTYRKVEVAGATRISREEGVYELEQKWWTQDAKLVKQTIPLGLLPSNITALPIYWFKNIDWQGLLYGSSELKGFERLLQGVSQSTTDQGVALSLEGLGVYATDGGRPVSDDGSETDWEVAPGKVMEVPAGAYFRRVEGLSTLKPSMDHINYLESKLREAGGLSDVALGRVDVQTAESGIALAIKFMPTLAKIEERDQSGLEVLTQFFYDWKSWIGAYEGAALNDKILCTIGEKLPGNRTELLNELNNMLDRNVISRKYYRQKMQELGYDFPEGMEADIETEMKKQVELTTPLNLVQNAQDAQAGRKPPPGQGNNSNNKNRPNESGGTEATQKTQDQARGGKPS